MQTATHVSWNWKLDVASEVGVERIAEGGEVVAVAVAAIPDVGVAETFERGHAACCTQKLQLNY